MFQGLRKNFSLEFLDNKIAEEQEKQKQDAETVSNNTTLAPIAKGKERATEVEPPSAEPTETQLPAEIQQKLNKFDKLSSRYQDLLRNYRTAHDHVAAIEPFEATLREHTPLTSISDPGAFAEFIKQRNLQSDMVLDELKRVTGEHSQDKKRIELLQNTIKALQEQRNEAEDGKKVLKAENDDLRLKLSGQTALRVPLWERIKDLEEKVKDHSTILREKNDQIEELKASNGSNPVLQPLIDSQIVELRQKIRVYTDMFGDTKDLIEALKAENGELHLKLSGNMNAQLEALEAEKVALQARLTGEAALKEQIAELKEECEELKQDILNHGGAAADAKHALKESTERLHKLEGEHVVLQEAYERACKDLANSERERAKLSEACAAVTAMRDALQSEVKRLQDLRDQTRELGIQLKERENRAESLEEELADAHRLLAERSREAETMRRMLSDVEIGADNKVTEMRQQLDLAVEERDRAESETTAIGRRKAREMEDLKNKLRNAEQLASRASDAKEDVERRFADYQRGRVDVEEQASQAREEVTEIRAAMGQLRATLDATEIQSSKLEKENVELRKTLEERSGRLEKLQRSARGMAEELNKLQAGKKAAGGSATPSRASNDSSRVTSPAPARRSTSSAQPPAVDSAYLKSVLLQFMEQKEKKHQLQLVPVLSQLLHMSKEDEQEWYAAVQAKW